MLANRHGSLGGGMCDAVNDPGLGSPASEPGTATTPTIASPSQGEVADLSDQIEAILLSAEVRRLHEVTD